MQSQSGDYIISQANSTRSTIPRSHHQITHLQSCQQRIGLSRLIILNHYGWTLRSQEENFQLSQGAHQLDPRLVVGCCHHQVVSGLNQKINQDKSSCNLESKENSIMTTEVNQDIKERKSPFVNQKTQLQKMETEYVIRARKCLQASKDSWPVKEIRISKAAVLNTEAKDALARSKAKEQNRYSVIVSTMPCVVRMIRIQSSGISDLNQDWKINHDSAEIFANAQCSDVILEQAGACVKSGPNLDISQLVRSQEAGMITSLIR